MMTEQRKKRLKQKIQQSRERLMETQPFFALLLMYLKFVAVPGMKKISTNGRCIYFSPDFLEKLYSTEMDYILCHQIMHIICGQIWRPYDLAGDDYHFACDIHINACLSEYGFTENKYAHLGEIYKKIPSFDENPIELTPETIYDSMPYSLYAFDERRRNRFLPDSDIWWDNKADNGKAGELILDFPELDAMLREGDRTVYREDNRKKNGGEGGEGDGDTQESGENDGEMQQNWQARAMAVAEHMESGKTGDKGIGNIPGFVRRMLLKTVEPKIDWKSILNNFVQECICDYSFSPPDRRYDDTGFFLPDFNEKDFVPKEILFMVDTSGSVEDDELAMVYAEMGAAIEQFKGKLTGKLGFFDVEVIPPLPFESVSDLMKIVPYGGGGTDFGSIFEYVCSNCRGDLPACIVIFTDGKGPYPEEKQAMGIPVLWIINNFEITPPWGRITRVVP